MKTSHTPALVPGVKRAIRHLAAVKSRRAAAVRQPAVRSEPLLERYRQAKQRKARPS